MGWVGLGLAVGVAGCLDRAGVGLGGRSGWRAGLACAAGGGSNGLAWLVGSLGWRGLAGLCVRLG